MKTIQEYWAALVAAGMELKGENIYGLDDNIDESDPMIMCEELYNNMKSLNGFKDESFVQLRKNGVDLVKLEWKRPTEQDVGKMCWFWNRGDGITLSKLYEINPNKEYFPNTDSLPKSFKRCLLATHGRLAPEPKDFEE